MSTYSNRRRLLAAALSLVVVSLMSSLASAVMPTGQYVAVLNEGRSNGDSMNSVTFFDANALSSPLFSVYVGREPVGSNEWEEPTAIAVNPATGDVYIVCFDSGTPSTSEQQDTAGDAGGDLDLLKINFASAYNHWTSNYQGHDVRGESLVTAGTPPSGFNNANNLSYVTYGNSSGDFNAFHSNQVVLPNVVEKIGQVARSHGNDFFDFALDFIDASTLVLMDDSIGLGASDLAADDHVIRLITKTSNSPGGASATQVVRGTGSSYINGGYNGANLNASFPQASTQTWMSKVVEMAGGGTGDPKLLNLDGTGHSEPEAIRYYRDPRTGVRGVWITEADYPATGDTIAFMQFDNNNETLGFRTIANTGLDRFTLSNDPAVGFDLKGSADNIFVDTDTGDLIVVESGFGDLANGVDTVDREPSILRVPVNYDNGSGQILLGTWQTKLTLNPTKTPGATGLIRGAWSEYDSVNNIVYFFSPGSGSPENPQFEMDIYTLDLDTGVTTSYLEVDDSVSLFLGDSFGDKQLAFTMPADYNHNGVVDAADYVVWRKTGINGEQGYADWRANFGKSAPSFGLAIGGEMPQAQVPEPAGWILGFIGILGLLLRRRSRGLRETLGVE